MKANFLTYFSQAMRFVIVAVVAVFIAFLFPNHTKFKYNFKQGQKWSYEDLVAPFDFPLLKEEGKMALEEEEIRRNFLPYYRYRSGVAQNFLTELETVLERDSIQNKAEILERSQFYFGKGIIELEEEHTNKSSVVLINENINKISSLSSFTSKDEIIQILLALNDSQAYQNFIQNGKYVNVTYDEELSDKFLSDELKTITAFNGKVSKGDIIVENKEIISNDTAAKLNSYKIAYEENISSGKSYIFVFAGYLLLTLLIIGVLLLYLSFYYKDIIGNWVKLSFVLFWLALYAYLVFVIENGSSLSTYLIPFCIIPIIIKNFYNERLALFVHIVVVLIASFLSNLGYEFTFLQIFAGIVTVLLVDETREWNKFFGAIIFIFLAYATSYLGLSLIKEGGFATIDWSIFVFLIINAVLTLLSYPFIPLIERVFGFTSSITLAELNDMNQPLLKELSLKAPGTLQHSLQVANLSESAADKIGANALLVKTAAMYHDIGKSLEPKYFIENQSGENPHAQLNNFESAEKIISHVTEGVKMAKKAKLPKIIIDFILTHHGTTRVEYFYRNQKNSEPEREFDEALFRYPGPKPKSKEQTILMLADSLEAACKSMKSPTGHDIDEMIRKVINHKLEQGQLDDSELNFDELEKVKTVFKSLLRSIHHVRIEYPEEQKQN